MNSSLQKGNKTENKIETKHKFVSPIVLDKNNLGFQITFTQIIFKYYTLAALSQTWR